MLESTELQTAATDRRHKHPTKKLLPLVHATGCSLNSPLSRQQENPILPHIF